MKTMRKVLPIIMLICLAVSLVSCAKDETEGEMDGWWKSAGGWEFTIKKGKVKCVNDGTSGTIKLSDLPNYKYVITLTKKLDGFTSDKKWYIKYSDGDYWLCLVDGGGFLMKKIGE